MSAARGIFAKEVLMPALLGLLLLAGLECLVRSDAVVAYIDRNQPISAGISPRFHVERQLWHLEALARRDVDRVAIVGSSSVVNGIDEAEIVAQLAQAGYPLQPQYLGLMVLLGYELPLLKQLLLTPRTKRIVYLYNLSSFSAEFHPEAIHSRWDLREALRLQPVSAWDTATLSSLADRTATNSFYLTRFRRFLKEFAARALTGTLAPPAHLYDYEPTEPEPPAERPRVMEPPVQPNVGMYWMRMAYLDSTKRPDNISYRGLERFCELARVAKVDLVFAPVVEPDFNRFNEYAQGSDRAAVDANVAKIAGRCGARFVPRDRFLAVEARDGLFRDHVHLSARGRALYTRMVGEMILETR
jgi:hypothetical protein